MPTPEGFPELSQLVTCVKDLSQPIGKRTHAAFYLRSLATADAIDALSQGKKFTKYICYVCMHAWIVCVYVYVWVAMVCR